MVQKTKAFLGQISDIDMRLLKVFKTVVQAGGMTAAELELGIGGSTISRHIKDLEIRLGLVLCRRGRSGFSLTLEGERVYAHTLQFLASIEAFKAGIDDIHLRMGGSLHVAVFDQTATNPASRIARAIEIFTEQAPDVDLHLHVAPLNAIERGVIDGQFHVGIVPQHRQSETLDYQKLFDEIMYLYCATACQLLQTVGDDLDWTTITKLPFAGLGYHSPNAILSQEKGLRRAATGYNQESIASLILSGKFIGFLPEHYAHSFVAQGLMQAICKQKFYYTCQFFSIIKHATAKSRAITTFSNCLRLAHR